MKTLSLIAAIVCSMFTINTTAAQSTKTETIKVWGNCSMCKTTIEKAAKTVGAKKADWNEDSKELTITYAVKKTSPAKIQEAVANAGYDTRDYAGNTDAYNKLPACCKYDRKQSGQTIGDGTTATTYSCPMHPEVTSDKPGTCSKCGMQLQENSKLAVAYYCPMKCEGDKTYDKPGKCPTCGMSLKKKQ